MTKPTLSTAIYLRWAGVWAPTVGLQAAYSGVDAVVNLQAIDFINATELQQWQLGSDGRIYLSGTSFCIDITSPIQNGSALVLNEVNASDQTQVWDWQSLAPAFKNLGASLNGSTQYVMDNSGGRSGPNNKVQVWQATGNANQAWSAEIILPAENIA